MAGPPACPAQSRVTHFGSRCWARGQLHSSSRLGSGESTIFRKSCINQCSATFLRSRTVAMVDAGRAEGFRFHKAVRDPKYAPAPSAPLQLNEVIAIKCPGRDLRGRSDIMSAGHNAHPLEMTFQRSPLPLKRVTDNGPISIRQNDRGGASMTWTIAARMIVG
jgi:hypothetical protein